MSYQRYVAGLYARLAMSRFRGGILSFLAAEEPTYIRYLLGLECFAALLHWISGRSAQVLACLCQATSDIINLPDI